MASFRTSERQSFFDVAIQRMGSIESAFALAVKNGLSLTDELAPGYSLELPDVIDKKVADYFKNKNITPATYAENASSQNENIEVIYWSDDLKRKTGIRVSENQSLFDIAVERLGSAEAAFDLAVKNRLSVTEVLSPGQTLALTDTVDADVAGYFTSRNLKPATAVTQTDESGELVLEGIGYWAIGIDFIVS